MPNPVQKMLDSHKTGRAYILARTAEMNKIYEAARERLMQTIVKHSQKYDTAPYSGKYLVKLSEQLQAEYAAFEQQLRAEMEYAIPYVAQSYYLMALNDMDVKDSKSILGNMDKERVKYFVESAYNDIGGATKKMRDVEISHLRNISAKVFRETSLTGETRGTVSRRLLNEATSLPGFRFVDNAGRKWDSKSYFDMLGRTVLMNASRASYMDACAAEGDDVVRVTVSGNPCPACAAYENTLLSISGATPGLTTVDEAIADGLMHPNCTHSLVAVPPAMMAKYDENGRPNTGLNSPDNVQVDNAETQKEYRQEQEKEAQSAAQSAIATKYDAVRYKQDVIDARGSEEAATILSNLYTGKIATITEPPPVVFRKNGNAYFSQGKIHLDPNIKTWHGAPTTICHEFGHFVDRKTRRKDPQRQAKWATAATADWQNVSQHGHIDFGRFAHKEKNLNEKAIDIFGKEYKLLSDDAKIRVAGWFDTIGSITNGRHGFGHSKSEYANGYENAEAFANIYAAINSGHTEYKKYFPEMWKLIESIIK